MKNIFINSFLVLGAAAVLATGCIKETFPEDGTATSSQVASSSSALKAMLNSIPAAMVTSGTAGYLSNYSDHTDFGIGGIHLRTENMLEDFVTLGSNPYYNRCYPYAMCQYQGPRYIYCAYFWDCYYAWIKTCNDVISSVLSAGEPSGTIAEYLGIAYAYRAGFYLDMARLYEYKANKYFDNSELLGLTVPIINENTKETDANNNPRATRADMYAFILSDLTNAAKYLKDVTTKDVYQPGIDYVNGLFARAYLEMGASGDVGAYENAITYAQKVIDAGYQVLTKAQWEDPTTGFNSAVSNSSWIYGIGIDVENFGNITTYAAHICSEGQWGYAPLAQYGASKSFYDSIFDGDFRKNSFVDPEKISTGIYKFAGTTEDQTGFVNGNSNVPAVAKYESIKFRPASGNCKEYKVGNAVDQPMMRIEEMYFIKAEALAQTNKLADAKTVLVDLIKTRFPDYECGASSTTDFLEELLLQKRIEFWGEGILIYDYKRLDHGITRGYTGTNWPADFCFNCEGRSAQWNFVITRAETQSNKGIPEESNNPDPSTFVPLWTDAE